MPPSKPVSAGVKFADKKDKKSEGPVFPKCSAVSTKIRRLILDGPETMIKKRSKGNTSSNQEPTFGLLQVQFKKQTRSLNKRFPDLSEETVSNIMAYTKQLPRFPRSDFIDSGVFKAQMFHQFHITDEVLMDQMYYVASKADRNPKVSVDNYAELMCIFLTDSLRVRVEFVFRVYDQRGDGEIKQDDIKRLIAPMVDNLNTDEHEGEEGDALNFMVNLLLNVLDIDKNGSISAEEFQTLVQKDRLMVQCLGNCLPEEKALETFKKKIIGRNPIEVGGLFRNERKRSLRDPDNCHLDDDVFEKLYPIMLEMP